MANQEKPSGCFKVYRVYARNAKQHPEPFMLGHYGIWACCGSMRDACAAAVRAVRQGSPVVSVDRVWIASNIPPRKLAIRIFGGLGYVEQCEIVRMWRDGRRVGP